MNNMEDDDGNELGSSWSDFENEDASKILKGLEAMIPGILKRSIVSGIASTLLSEEGLRAIVSEKRDIPKDAVSFLLSQADSTRKEILRIISREVRMFLENVDFGGEIAKILTTLSFEIRTEVRFIPNDEAVRPNIRNRVKVKRTKEDGEVETISEFEDATEPAESKIPPAAPKEPRPEKVTRRWTRRKPDEE